MAFLRKGGAGFGLGGAERHLRQSAEMALDPDQRTVPRPSAQTVHRKLALSIAIARRESVQTRDRLF
jgi:hypothetical protein